MAFIGNQPKWKVGGFTPQASIPANPREGDVYYEDGTNDTEGLYLYKNSAWVRIAQATELSSPSGYYTTAVDYAVLDGDGYGDIFVTASTKIVTLPTASANTNRIITIIHDVSAGGTVVVKGEAAGETLEGVNGSTGITLNIYREKISFQCTGSAWRCLKHHIPSNWVAFTPTGSWTTNTTYNGVYRRVGDTCEVDVRALLSGAPDSTPLTINLPSGLTMDTAKMSLATALNPIGSGSASDAGTANYTNLSVGYSTDTSVQIFAPGADQTYVYLKGNVTQAVPYTFANTDFVIIRFSVPIVGWQQY